MKRGIMMAALAAGVLTVWLSQDGFPRGREYHPELGRFMQRDPIGYPDGMNQYEYERSNPVTNRDPSGERILFEKSGVKSDTVSGRKSGTIHLYLLLRYAPDDDLKKRWGANADAQLKLVASEHKRIMENYFNTRKYAYNDGQVNWDMKLTCIITTEKPYSVGQFVADEAKARMAKNANEELPAVYAKQKVYSKTAGAYELVTLTDQPQKEYSPGLVPATVPPKTMTMELCLAHELIGHMMNNHDEINGHQHEGNNADVLRKTLGREIEADSIMTYNPNASKFYDRHFAAGIDDINNLTGKKEDRYNDVTSELNVSDPWFSIEKNPLVEQKALEEIRKIIGGQIP